MWARKMLIHKQTIRHVPTRRAFVVVKCEQQVGRAVNGNLFKSVAYET